MNLFRFSCLLLPCFIFAETKSFDFKDSKGLNTVIFQLDALLESINGSASGVSGKIDFDPDDPAVTKGVIILESSSLRVDNPVLQEHMHGDDWLDVTKFPKIEFSLSNLTRLKVQGRSIHASAEGKMTIRNVTIKMSIPVELTYLEGMLEKRNRIPGDLLIVRSKFSVKRDDFGIRAGEYLDKVANNIEISINLAGVFPSK